VRGQEEMRPSNEELQSVNEEFALDSGGIGNQQEELRSSKEELQTVEENRHKVEELAQLTSDLQNLMAAAEIATLFLDRDLRILRVTVTLVRTPRAGSHSSTEASGE
jgi:two-component system CheB/CheR fusion protein